MIDAAANTLLVLAIATSVTVYLWIHRWRQRGRVGPKDWPLIGSLFEVTANAHRIHDWSYEYMKKSPRGTVEFSVNGVRSILVARPDNVEHMLKANFPTYIKDLLLRMTMDSICKIGFGVDQHNLSTDLPQVQFATAFDSLTLWTMARTFDPAWKLKKTFNLGTEKKFRALLPVLDSFTYGVIRDRRLELARLYAMGQTLERHDLLSRFMAAKDENGQGLSDKLHYFQAAISETLRLHPAVARDAKYAVNDDVLPDGTIVRGGNQVVYVPYTAGRLESLWGPDASQFRPERWLKDGWYQHESPYKFSAFQAGPRICLGKDTAYLQMKMTAAMILRFFRFFQEVPDQSVAYNVSIVMSIKNGLKGRIITRSPLGKEHAPEGEEFLTAL